MYTKDVRESTTNVIGSDGLAEVSYTYDEYDTTTGLYNLNARYYSPEAGTFLESIKNACLR